MWINTPSSSPKDSLEEFKNNFYKLDLSKEEFEAFQSEFEKTFGLNLEDSVLWWHKSLEGFSGVIPNGNILASLILHGTYVDWDHAKNRQQFSGNNGSAHLSPLAVWLLCWFDCKDFDGADEKYPRICEYIERKFSSGSEVYNSENAPPPKPKQPSRSEKLAKLMGEITV